MKSAKTQEDYRSAAYPLSAYLLWSACTMRAYASSYRSPKLQHEVGYECISKDKKKMTHFLKPPTACGVHNKDASEAQGGEFLQQ